MKYILPLIILILTEDYSAASYLNTPNILNYQPIIYSDIYSHKEYPLQYWYDDFQLENNRENYRVDENDIGIRTGNQSTCVYLYNCTVSPRC